MSPFVVRGSSIAFENRFDQQIGDTKILVSGPVASISLKAHAFDNNTNRIKDPYDIFAIIYSVVNIDRLLSSWASINPFVEESLELLRRIFESGTSPGQLP